MQNHVAAFIPRQPRPGEQINRLFVKESSSRADVEQWLHIGWVAKNAKGVWEWIHIPTNGNTHPQVIELAKAKADAMNKNLSKSEGGDPSCEEIWQHGRTDGGSIIWQNGKELKQRIHLGGYRLLHWN